MRILALILLFITPMSLAAQISGSHIGEFQIGNLPDQRPKDRSSLYNQLNLAWKDGPFRIESRFESYESQESSRRYLEPTRVRFTYLSGMYAVRLGHLNETIGRGLLLRTYEIPGTIYEDAAYRTRYAFQRDLFGASAGVDAGHYGFRAIKGRPLWNILPPGLPEDDRRPDGIEALTGYVAAPFNSTVGGAFMRHIDVFGTRGFAMGHLEVPILGWNVYSEYARRTSSGDPAFAAYMSADGALGPVGLSIELKRYHDFRLGAGFNDPPPLVREQPWALLNRSTHVLETTDERGFQVEAYIPIGRSTLLTLNRSQARNELFRTFRYESTYAEVAYKKLKVFTEAGSDDLLGETGRRTAGGQLMIPAGNAGGFTINLQAQRFDQAGGDAVRNGYLAMAWSAVETWSIGTTAETTSDGRNWLGGTVSWQSKGAHRLDVFAGTRRGGPACTSGICYEVLDFEGAELKLITRF